jgi:tRNA threonylcarbamoyladenosine biosynthesis protein TsaB
MLILGIETSGLRGGIAVCRDGVCLADAALENAPRRHAQTLVTQIQATLEPLGVRIADLEAVAVSIGPGSFTGLRVGVVCGKTLAYAIGCRLAAVDTLEAIAANSPADLSVVHVIADAQRGDLFVGTYQRSSEGDWIRKDPPTIVLAREWVAALQAGDVVSGPGLAAVDRSPASATWRSLPESAWTPSARTVAQIGARQIARGLLADCATLEPFYLRRSAAEERADPAGSSTAK